MNTFIKAATLLTATFAGNALAEEKLNPGVMAAIFKTYDTPIDEEPDCQPDYVDEQICPSDEKIPCASIPEIEAYCKEILGKDIAKQMDGVEKEKELNAIEGCVKYVGYHVIDADQLACCPSEHCEDWLEDLFSNLEGYYDDDDDDYDGEEF